MGVGLFTACPTPGRQQEEKEVPALIRIFLEPVPTPLPGISSVVTLFQEAFPDSHLPAAGAAPPLVLTHRGLTSVITLITGVVTTYLFVLRPQQPVTSSGQEVGHGPGPPAGPNRRLLCGHRAAGKHLNRMWNFWK